MRGTIALAMLLAILAGLAAARISTRPTGPARLPAKVSATRPSTMPTSRPTSRPIPKASPTSAPASRPANIPDICRDAIEPYFEGKQRITFLRACGHDVEMTAREFAKDAADANHPERFVQVFDRWRAMLHFDGNRNGQIDWLEAEKYRNAFRAVVMKRFDKDSDGRLRGPERYRANYALFTGKLHANVLLPGTQATTQPATKNGDDAQSTEQAEPPTEVEPEPEMPPAEVSQSPYRNRMLERYDEDGDGKLSDSERRKAFKEMGKRRREQRLARFDTDGDGELSEAERKAMRQSFRERQSSWKQVHNPWRLKLLDQDFDGEISPEEEAALKDFDKQFGSAFQETLFRRDIDGDGEVSDDERRRNRRKQQMIGLDMMMRFRNEMDSDGDGTVSFAERIDFTSQMQDGISMWMSDFVDAFDSDLDGRISAPERETLLDGWRMELDDRRAEHDRNGDDELSSGETVSLMVQWAEEAGIITPRSDDEEIQDIAPDIDYDAPDL